MGCGSKESGNRPLSRFPLRGKAGAGGFPPRRQNRAAPPTRGVSNRSAETPLVHPPSAGRTLHPNGVSIYPIGMEDRELYRRILGIENPWRVASVDLQLIPKEVHIYLAHEDLPTWPCPECAAPSKPYDYLPVPHHPARRASPLPMPYPRRARRQTPLGRTLQPLYRPV